jgi:hypothetical protein
MIRRIVAELRRNVGSLASYGKERGVCSRQFRPSNPVQFGGSWNVLCETVSGGDADEYDDQGQGERRM